MTHRLEKETMVHAKNLFITNPTMQHRQTILSENQPLPSTSNNLYSPRLVAVTPSETRRLLAPYSPAFRHPTPPPMAKRGPWKTRRRLLSKISLHAGQARPSLSRSSRDRWTRVKRVGEGGGDHRVRRIRCVEPGGGWREMGEEEWGDGGGWKGGGWRGGRQGLRDQYVCWGMWTTWVGGGQQPAAADWPTATPRPRPLPHTVS